MKKPLLLLSFSFLPLFLRDAPGWCERGASSRDRRSGDAEGREGTSTGGDYGSRNVFSGPHHAGAHALAPGESQRPARGVLEQLQPPVSARLSAANSLVCVCVCVYACTLCSRSLVLATCFPDRGTIQRAMSCRRCFKKRRDIHLIDIFCLIFVIFINSFG